jgi:hypothetical protein
MRRYRVRLAQRSEAPRESAARALDAVPLPLQQGDDFVAVIALLTQ